MFLAVGLVVICAVASSLQQEVFFMNDYYPVHWKVYRTPVEVGVYYESQCPDSQEFIINQLVPTYFKDPQLTSPVFIPYGKAETIKTPTGYNFTCQHGPSECLGNKIHACAINIIHSKPILLRYIACMMNQYEDPETIGVKCALQYGINWYKIAECAKGRMGCELLRMYGEQTAALNPPVSFIPTVTLNGSQGNQTAILYDLLGEVCKAFKDPKPVECHSAIMRLLNRPIIWKENGLYL